MPIVKSLPGQGTGLCQSGTPAIVHSSNDWRQKQPVEVSICSAHSRTCAGSKDSKLPMHLGSGVH
ncbi:rCG37050 [Rattus norvegicus]|uniref:RCG37050 n=1 Tax=Rattus norvegicus TaxID=10116 RepID=A6HTR0_RAT|nr:rCG37050 [Rattus norvegicus]